MRFRFIDEHRKAHEVGLMCRVLEVSRGGFYAWRKRPPSERKRESERLVDRIRVAHAASRQLYGAPRVHADLVAQGASCSLNRVARLMRKAGVRARTYRRYRVTTQSNHRWPLAPNRLKRRFRVKKPNQVWVADITYVRTGEGWLYVAGIVDLFSRKVVGWAKSKSLSAGVALDALRMALTRRRPGAGLMHHSDRGCQYACDDYRALLDKHGITPSMSRKGNCWDNAVMESFFRTLKTELVYLKFFRTREDGGRELFEFIEVYYNRQRRHSTLGYISPAEFERKASTSRSSRASA